MKNLQGWVIRMSDNLRSRAEQRVDNKIGFYRSLSVYIIINVILAVINWIFTPQFWWVIFPIAFWGIGVFVKFLKAFVFVNHFDNESYRERKIQEEMERLRD